MTPAQRRALTAIAATTLYVGRDPARPWQGARLASRTLQALVKQGLVARGLNEPLRGRPLLLTPAGQDALTDGSTPR